MTKFTQTYLTDLEYSGELCLSNSFHLPRTDAHRSENCG